ncbi:hypothetical protein C7271_02795 [filamentous cyanobacterium CCP5]|nr:hypothetical protein C7271_02795 [filamentous cyanobacterium CCP5]
MLLGRITSLVKNHIDLGLSHLWVVYPRTRLSEQDGSPELHLQIVGVWEPETLGLPGEDSGTSDVPETAGDEPSSDPETSTAASSSSAAEGEEAPAAKVDLDQLPEVDDNYFSIRGEILKYEPEDQLITVKILQNPRRGSTARKAFRLTVKGELTGRTVGYFWNLDVRREDSVLVLNQGQAIGIVPPTKKKGQKGTRGGPRRGGSDRRPGGSGRPRPRRSDDAKEGSKVVIKRHDRDL